MTGCPPELGAGTWLDVSRDLVGPYDAFDRTIRGREAATMTNSGIDWENIEKIIQEAEKTGGTLGVTIIAPSGETFIHNGERKFGAASTVKIPLMVEIFRQIDRGERSLDDEYVLDADDIAVGSGVMLYLHHGMTFTLNDLIYLMISISDNTATNILIDMAGMDAVNETMRSLGMTNSNLGRKMKGRPAQAGEQENWATPDDYAAAVKSILEGHAASADSCRKMQAMLAKQQNSRRISRYLPESEDIRWGSKTGSVKGVTNDVGFITSPAGTMIIGVYCEALPDQHTGEKAIGDISRAAMAATGVVEPLWTS
jgi:beta-lactamase class A